MLLVLKELQDLLVDQDHRGLPELPEPPVPLDHRGLRGLLESQD